MKAISILSVAALVAGCASAGSAQTVYSGNIVGYINLPFYAGTNYFASQLANSDNSLDTIFYPGVVPEGATFTELDSTTHEFLPTSTYDTATGWSINYTLAFGQGGWLDTPLLFTNTFTGSVWPGYSPLSSQPFTPPLVTASGTQFLSCFLPIDATFYDVVGRDPLNGESVTTLDAATQTCTTTTFDNGAWDNGAPDLDVGEAAFFNLSSVVPVPEPSATCLAATGALIFIGLSCFRRLTQRRSA
jgi:hypothetical protein